EFLITFASERCVLKRRNNQGSPGQEKKFIQYLLLKGRWGNWRNTVFIPSEICGCPCTNRRLGRLRYMDCQISVIP
ncbi:hypothetical protein, partial [Intestinimonas butyriciproducens]|uniref:hypothetical protein n=1 Tax=Intestinimonas butyriciproducens TaxID=1297617 RepID=UPI00195C8099